VNQITFQLDGVARTLNRSDMLLSSDVERDDLTSALIKPFDYEWDGTSTFAPFQIPTGLPQIFGIGLIVGASGTGKSPLLREFGVQNEPEWAEHKSIAAHFASSEDAAERLMAVGLMSVPDWVKPYHALSTGQKFRADLARQVQSGAVVDEFTSVVDRNVAKSASSAMSKFIRRRGITNVVLASCHRDIVDWLEPDWIIDTDRGEVTIGRSLQRPEVVVEVHPASHAVWTFFAPHHYLTGELNKATHCYVAVWEQQLVGFYAVMTNPAGTLKNAWRGHRLVVMPDYQGLGIGPRLSETVAQHYVDNGCRFFAKTAHPRLGSYRDASPRWKPTSKNHRLRTDANLMRSSRWHPNPDRWSFSHEYIGDAA